MINRDNRYVSADTKQIKASVGKKILVSIGGALMTASLLTGCGKPVEENIESMETSQIETELFSYYQDMTDFDFSIYDQDIESIYISGTNLEDISALSRFTEAKDVDLSSNLITDISTLDNLSEIEYLDISNNSISSIDLSQYQNLKHLEINGNYALYTEDVYNYCQEHGINLDITLEDIKEANQVKEILSSLNLEGMSDLDKENAILNYITGHMEYDTKAIDDDELCMDYNLNPLKYALEGKGVCANYTALFDAMCDISGINCFSLVGEAKGSSHAWNLVEIDGTYMLCDSTWCDQESFIYDKIAQARNFNETGSSAERFNEDHQETTNYHEEIEVAARSNMAVSSDFKDIEYQDHTSLKARVNNIIENIDLSKEDVNKLLAGIALGSVVLLTVKNQKKIKKAVEEKNRRKQLEREREQQEKEKKEREKRREEELKRQKEIKLENETPKQEPITTSKEETKQILSQELEKEEIKEKEPTVEEVLMSLPTVEEKLAYLKQKSNESLRKAAEIQVDQEKYLNIIKVYNDEKAIQDAMQELLSLMDKTKDEKFIYRMNKGQDTNKELTLEKLETYRKIKAGASNTTSEDLSTIILTLDSQAPTERIYSEVDKEMENYKGLLSLSKQLINNEVENMSVNQYDSNSQPNIRKMGYIKVSLLATSTLIISGGILLLGMYLMK